MVTFGNHIKFTVHPSQREKVQTFYKDLLQCEMLASPKSDLDLFQFSNDVFLGVYYSADALPESAMLQAAWLEIKSDNILHLKEALIKFGVKEIDYQDKSNFYFQAPGGQVFRLSE